MKFLLMLLFLLSTSLFAEDCKKLPEKIKSCTPFSCVESINIPGMKPIKFLDIEIEGMRSGVCVYYSKTETPKYKMKMKCKVKYSNLKDHAKLFEYTLLMRSGDMKKAQKGISIIKRISARPHMKNACKPM